MACEQPDERLGRRDSAGLLELDRPVTSGQPQLPVGLPCLGVLAKGDPRTRERPLRACRGYVVVISRRGSGSPRQIREPEPPTDTKLDLAAGPVVQAETVSRRE